MPPTLTSDRKCGTCPAGALPFNYTACTLCPDPPGTYVPPGSSGNCSTYLCQPGIFIIMSGQHYTYCRKKTKKISYIVHSLSLHSYPLSSLSCTLHSILITFQALQTLMLTLQRRVYHVLAKHTRMRVAAPHARFAQQWINKRNVGDAEGGDLGGVVGRAYTCKLQKVDDYSTMFGQIAFNFCFGVTGLLTVHCANLYVQFHL